MSAAWMRRPSPQGWVYGVPRVTTLLRPSRKNTEPTRFGFALCALACRKRPPAAGRPTSPAALRRDLRPTDLG
ncbi:hypothetical protein DBR33_00535 [Stenotrophomonas sp. HMWF022]|nr:hypothetical protein DBR20_21170 [Stenotrophomonas sp. HMWF023]PTT58645.1 hypothetical protein DBR33_00535 [Stenotrophomonas sp. HMWF022]